MTIKLAEALLRRKELEAKVKQLHPINANKQLFEVKAQRVKVTDALDDIVATVPKVNISQITEEYDFYSSQLRKIDSVIQQANWTTLVEADSMLQDYKAVTAK